MKFYVTLGLSLLLGCGSKPPPSTNTAVVVPNAPATVIPDSTPDTTEPAPPSKPRLQITIGDETVCLRVDGSVRCWSRQVGAQVTILSALPPIAGIGDVSDVAVGGHHVCALTIAGKVFCWGNNANGQLGARRSEDHIDTPVQVEGIEGATGLAAGLLHTCVLLGDGRVSCWGWNKLGQTGSDVEYAPETRELVGPEIVAGINGVTTIAAGRNQTCARTKTGWSCWGQSHIKSQSTIRGSHHNEPTEIAELADMEQMTLEDETACGLFKDGHVGCWGSGAFSILPSRPLRANVPLPVILPVARSLAAGKYHGCAILQDDRVSCWGLNTHGELGRALQPGYTPHESGIVEGLPLHVDSLTLGSATSCAIVRNHELWCWGIAPHLPWTHGAGSGTPARVPIEP